MADYRVGELARACGISRTTLLHYERQGLLRPPARSQANYRRYSEADRLRLLRIRELRSLGLSLTQIAPLLDDSGSGVEAALRQRFDQLGTEIAQARRQQQQIVELLQGCRERPAGAMDKNAWSALMRASGMDDDGMWRWHAAFERREPDGHRQFLLGLGVDDNELERIRRWSREYPVRPADAVE
ncbi:MerR family transcriptional regulator [Motiliproteus sediminis]|uniref:MerR family transcriptional regulator n=1 Tax=Motiliproteus sediminis TaxID=1468178 RepID=UPI001AEFB33B|nr:MerR family transcriptional regulator [Motiliproteus sediminis]